jgi:hypothetical protein
VRQLVRDDRDTTIDGKALSQRIGHADVPFTMKRYVHAERKRPGRVILRAS